MNKEQDFENYLSISPNKLGLYLFDSKNLTNLYREELVINESIISLDYSKLKKFLDNNIFKIEKYSGKFVENIYVVLEGGKVLNLEIGIKKKNYNSCISREYLENLLLEAKDLFRENYPNQEIMHMIINNYYIDNKIHRDAWELGSGVSYSIKELFNMFKERFNATSIYVDDQPGNYRKTLRINDDVLKQLDWKPQDRLNDYIKSLNF